VHGGIPAPVVPDLRVRHQAVPLEDADRAGRDIEARPLPVPDDVGLLDLDGAEVVQFLGGRHLEDGPRIGFGQGSGDESLGQLHERQ
jgi:hypothetical protein